jgi:HEAT repeat protein
VALLVAELRTSAADHIRARAAVALGAIGDVGAVRPLVELASDRSSPDLARAIAMAALGLIVDPEDVRSLSRLAADTNYLARTDALNEALSLL